MNVTVAQAVASLRPGMPFVLRGEHVDGLEWHVANVTSPTRAEVDAEIARLEQAAVDAAAAKAAARAALLERLGITEDEAALLRDAL